MPNPIAHAAATATLTVSLALGAAATAGCGVNKDVHARTLAQLKATEAELSETRNQRDALEKDKSGLSAEKSAESERAAGLAKQMQATEAELIELRKQREASEKRLAAFKELKQRFAALVDTGKLEVVFRNGQMALKLPSGILFASGQAELSKEGQAALAEVLNVLLQFKDRRFAVGGHTDTDPIKSKKFKSNWELSQARALSVVQAMITAGFDPKNLAAAGYAEFDPVAANDGEPNKQLNRRIEIVLVPDLSELPNLTSSEP